MLLLLFLLKNICDVFSFLLSWCRVVVLIFRGLVRDGRVWFSFRRNVWWCLKCICLVVLVMMYSMLLMELLVFCIVE